MKHILLILFLFVSCVPGRAGEWKAFVGYGNVMDIPGHADVEIFPFTLRFEPEYNSTGKEFELGIRSAKSEFYVAYHSSISTWKDAGSWYDREQINDSTWRSTSWYNRGAWEENRILLGYRYHPISHGALSPLMGAAVGIGFSRYKSESRYHAYEYIVTDSTGYFLRTLRDDYSEDATSTDVNVGGLVEFGVALRIKGGLEALLLAQIHFYYVEFGNDWYLWWNQMDRQINTMPSCVLQARYTFGR